MSSLLRCFRCRVSHHTSAPINITHRGRWPQIRYRPKPRSFARSQARTRKCIQKKISHAHAHHGHRRIRDVTSAGMEGFRCRWMLMFVFRPQPAAATAPVVVVVTAAFVRQDVVFQTLLLGFVSISGIPNASTFNNLFQSVTKSTTHSLSLTL